VHDADRAWRVLEQGSADRAEQHAAGYPGCGGQDLVFLVERRAVPLLSQVQVAVDLMGM